MAAQFKNTRQLCALAISPRAMPHSALLARLAPALRFVTMWLASFRRADLSKYHPTARPANWFCRSLPATPSRPAVRRSASSVLAVAHGLGGIVVREVAPRSEARTPGVLVPTTGAVYSTCSGGQCVLWLWRMRRSCWPWRARPAARCRSRARRARGWGSRSPQQRARSAGLCWSTCN